MRKPPFKSIFPRLRTVLPKTKEGLENALCKQALYAVGTSFVGLSPFTLACHGIAYLGSVLYEPSKPTIKQIESDLNITLEKEPFDKQVGLATAAFTTAAIAPYLYFQKDIIMGANTFTDFVALAMRAGIFFEFARTGYRMLKNISVLNKQDVGNIQKNISVYFKKPQTKSQHINKQLYTFSKRPEQALTSIVKDYFSQNISPSPIINPALEKIYLSHYFNDPKSAFITSLIGARSSKQVHQALFDKSVDTSLEQQDLSFLSLLSLYDYMENNSTQTFKKQIPLLLEEKNLKETILSGGTFSTTRTLGFQPYQEDAISMTLVQKISTDKQRLQDKKTLHDLLSQTKYVHPIIDYTELEEVAITSELRLHHPTLYQSLAKDPSLYEEAYLILGRLQEEMQNSSVDFEKIDFEKKYLDTPLIESKKYIQTIVAAINQFEDLQEFKPILDFHANNIFVVDDTLVNIDVENKGLGPKVLDIVNLVDYTNKIVPLKTLNVYRKKLLKSYQEEINKETPYMQSLYLHALALRRNSYMQARKDGHIYTDKPFIYNMLDHCAQQFSYYATQPAQRKLATMQLEVTESLRKSI